MIYKRNANFPYPLLTNESTYYEDNTFSFDVDMSSDKDNYVVEIKDVELGSEFIQNQIDAGNAIIYLIVKGPDNYFYPVDNTYKVKVPMKQMSFTKNANLQLIIMATQDISYENNNDLVDFYDDIKKDIVIEQGQAMAFSNVIVFNGDMKKPLDLFEMRLDTSMEEDIKFDLSGETITVVYKDENIMFNDLRESRNLRNMYLYMGLYKAISQLYEDEVKPSGDLRVSDITTDNALYQKLLLLMESKNIDYLTLENLENTIYLISDRLIDKYASAIRSLDNGN